MSLSICIRLLLVDAMPPPMRMDEGNGQLKQQDNWYPTKYSHARDGRLVAGPSVPLGSRFVGGILADAYSAAISEWAEPPIIDLGCGPVPLYAAYRSIDANPVCVDWSSSTHETRHVDVMADLNNGSLEGVQDGLYGTALATDLLEHLWNPLRLVEEVERSLMPGGVFIIGVPFLYWIHEEPYDFHRYTEYRLRQLCEQGGLEVISIEPYGGPLEVINDILSKSLAGIPLLYSVHRSLANWIHRRRIGARYWSRFPLGYTVVARKPWPPVRPGVHYR